MAKSHMVYGDIGIDRLADMVERVIASIIIIKVIF